MERLVRFMARGPVAICAASALTIIMYAVAYLALLTPGMVLYWSWGYRSAEYRCPSAVVGVVFSPANWIDKHVRPEYWNWGTPPPLLMTEPPGGWHDTRREDLEYR